jgi:hypothetical protein
VCWLIAGWAFGKDTGLVSMARCGHIGAIYAALKFTLHATKYISRYSDEQNVFLAGSIFAILVGVVLGEFLYRKFAPKRSFFITFFESRHSNGVNSEEKVDIQEHLRSVSHGLPTIGDLKDTLVSDDPTVKFWAIAELERIGTEEALSLLERFANTDNIALKTAAIEAILKVRNTHKGGD